MALKNSLNVNVPLNIHRPRPVQEDLKPTDVDTILDALARGETPAPGPRCVWVAAADGRPTYTSLCSSNGRKAAEPVTGLTSLTSPPRGPGFGLRTDGAL